MGFGVWGLGFGVSENGGGGGDTLFAGSLLRGLYSTQGYERPYFGTIPYGARKASFYSPASAEDQPGGPS